MNKQFLFVIIKRFLKAFFLGGISSTLVLATSNPLILTEWKLWLAALVTAFLTGGLMALEKLAQGWNPQ